MCPQLFQHFEETHHQGLHTRHNCFQEQIWLDTDILIEAAFFFVNWYVQPYTLAIEVLSFHLQC